MEMFKVEDENHSNRRHSRGKMTFDFGLILKNSIKVYKSPKKAKKGENTENSRIWPKNPKNTKKHEKTRKNPIFACGYLTIGVYPGEI